MSVFETIKKRRSIGKMSDARPTRQQIEHLLEAATHAPNHHNVQPWRFIVLAGEARAELGGVMAASLAERLGATGAALDSEKAQDLINQALISKERHKLLRSPIVIVVVSEQPRQPKVLAIENIEATAAAVQNILLAAEEMGLAAMWRTGDAAADPRVKRWLGVDAADHIVAFVYLGFPAMPKLERHPVSFKEKTTWIGWNEE